MNFLNLSTHKYTKFNRSQIAISTPVLVPISTFISNIFTKSMQMFVTVNLKTYSMKTSIIKTTPSLIILFTLLAFSFTTGVQAQMANADKGVFQFDMEEIDYGTIQQNDNGVRKFTFTNRGRAPILISKVNTSCGCTVPSFSKEAVLPGERGIIEVKYSAKKTGRFSKSITVISNADEPMKTLKIKGNVVAKSNSL